MKVSGEQDEDSNGKDISSGSEDGNSVIYVTSSDARSISINGLFFLAVLYTLYFASSFLIPIVLAVLLALLLSPVVNALESVRVPRAMGAAIVVLAATTGIMVIVYGLAKPADDWFHRLPQGIDRIERKLADIKRPFQQLQDAGEKLERATDLKKSGPQTKSVEIERPGIVAMLFTGTTRFLASLGMLVLLLFFLLASGDTFLRKLVTIIPKFEDKKRAVEIARRIERDISFYLLMLTATNIALGCAVGLVMHAVGLSNSVLWGALTVLFSYAPYAGSAVMAVLLGLVGMTTFESWFDALLPVALFVVLVSVFSNLVMPVIVGNRLTLSPLAIFVSILFWGWMWGVAGALLAVPLLASFKITCERIQPLRPVAEFLTP